MLFKVQTVHAQVAFVHLCTDAAGEHNAVDSERRILHVCLEHWIAQLAFGSKKYQRGRGKLAEALLRAVRREPEELDIRFASR